MIEGLNTISYYFQYTTNNLEFNQETVNHELCGLSAVEIQFPRFFYSAAMLQLSRKTGKEQRKVKIGNARL